MTFPGKPGFGSPDALTLSIRHRGKQLLREKAKMIAPWRKCFVRETGRKPAIDSIHQAPGALKHIINALAGSELSDYANNTHVRRPAGRGGVGSTDHSANSNTPNFSGT
jgi:hypothetical protein